ncbi:ArsR/SmtB family transcription factor [Sulfurospirillum arcachonense]|uniref:ArsR/SmtB family transcription factor n=1 Tax=Sulfurospirillum arcachonense TaxID=57666 RepID=UPI0004695C28|nr:metalloregulator ArsR/SmtB family transcription factor [Sulfurospirillum arcachonense]
MTENLIRSCCEDVSFIPDIKKTLPKEKELVDITCIYKALSDPTRVKILFALLKYEICVGEMVNLLELPQSHVSHQLKILRKYNIVTYKKDKKMSFYRIINPHVKDLLQIALKNVQCQKKK